jgi:FHA domain
MFYQRFIDPLLAPFRAINGKIVQYRSVKGNIKVDINRVKGLGNNSKRMLGNAQKQVGGAFGGGQGQPGAQPGQPQQGMPQQGQPQQGQPQQGQMPYQGMQQSQQPMQPMQGIQPGYGQPAGQQMQQPGMPPGMMPQGAGMPGGPQGAPGQQMINASPPVRTTGFWFWKKFWCSGCGTQLDPTWDGCPFCAQAAASAAAAAKPALKTQAFVLDSTGSPGSVQLLGWLIPLQGPQRGELFQLAALTTIGTANTCTVCLQDGYMSSKHAEIKAEGGVWVLKDAGSTNGTYVNNRRVDKHELIDNDFIKFGSALIKFKSL